jgi:hypothetical protein
VFVTKLAMSEQPIDCRESHDKTKTSPTDFRSAPSCDNSLKKIVHSWYFNPVTGCKNYATKKASGEWFKWGISATD